MDQEAHANEFRALSLLLQHRHLLARLDWFDDAIERLRWEDLTHGQSPHRIWQTELARSLRQFTRELAHHFDVESRSTREIFREHPDRELVGTLQELDRQHGSLFQAFVDITDRIEEAEQPRDEILTRLEALILEFRRHEASEDELFGKG